MDSVACELLSGVLVAEVGLGSGGGCAAMRVVGVAVKQGYRSVWSLVWERENEAGWDDP